MAATRPPGKRFIKMYVDRIDPAYTVTQLPDGKTVTSGGLRREHLYWFLSKDADAANAVFVLPDNGVDYKRENAAGPLRDQPQDPGEGGLAKPMRPKIISSEPSEPEAKRGTNILTYDFHAVGVPTGKASGVLGWTSPDDKPSENGKTPREMILEGFADIYQQLGAGKHVVIPYNERGPAFGYGIFKDYPEKLYQLISDEFTKLEKFCDALDSPDPNAKATALAGLSEQYRNAFNGEASATPKFKVFPAAELAKSAIEPEVLAGKGQILDGIASPIATPASPRETKSSVTISLKDSIKYKMLDGKQYASHSGNPYGFIQAANEEKGSPTGPEKDYIASEDKTGSGIAELWGQREGAKQEDRIVVKEIEKLEEVFKELNLTEEEKQKFIQTTLTETFATLQADLPSDIANAGSTAAANIIYRNKVYNASLGDADTFVVIIDAAGNPRVSRVNKVHHTPTEPEEKKRLEKAGIRFVKETEMMQAIIDDPDHGLVVDGRLGGVLNISGAIGDKAEEEHGLTHVPDLYIDAPVIQPGKGERVFVITACDGMADAFGKGADAKTVEQGLVTWFQQYQIDCKTKGIDPNDPTKMAQFLAKCADDHYMELNRKKDPGEKKGGDNISVIVTPLDPDSPTAKAAVVFDGHAGDQVSHHLYEKFPDVFSKIANQKIEQLRKEKSVKPLEEKKDTDASKPKPRERKLPEAEAELGFRSSLGIELERKLFKQENGLFYLSIHPETGRFELFITDPEFKNALPDAFLAKVFPHIKSTERDVFRHGKQKVFSGGLESLDRFLTYLMPDFTQAQERAATNEKLLLIALEEAVGSELGWCSDDFKPYFNDKEGEGNGQLVYKPKEGKEIIGLANIQNEAIKKGIKIPTALFQALSSAERAHQKKHDLDTYPYTKFKNNKNDLSIWLENPSPYPQYPLKEEFIVNWIEAVTDKKWKKVFEQQQLYYLLQGPSLTKTLNEELMKASALTEEDAKIAAIESAYGKAVNTALQSQANKRDELAWEKENLKNIIRILHDPEQLKEEKNIELLQNNILKLSSINSDLFKKEIDLGHGFRISALQALEQAKNAGLDPAVFENLKASMSIPLPPDVTYPADIYKTTPEKAKQELLKERDDIYLNLLNRLTYLLEKKQFDGTDKNIERIKNLIDQIPPERINSLSTHVASYEHGSGATPLIRVIRAGNTELLKYMLEKGVDPNYVIERPYLADSVIHPLKIAMQDKYKNDGVIGLLMEHKAQLPDPKPKTPEPIVPTVTSLEKKDIQGFANDVTEFRWNYKTAEEFKTVRATINAEVKKHIPSFQPSTDMLSMSSSISTPASEDKSISLVIVKGKTYDEADDEKKKDITVYSLGHERKAKGEFHSPLRVLHISNQFKNGVDIAAGTISAECLELIKKMVDDYVVNSKKSPIEISGTDENLKFAAKCYCEAMQKIATSDADRDRYLWVDYSDLKNSKAPAPAAVQFLIDNYRGILSLIPPPAPAPVMPPPDKHKEEKAPEDKKDTLREEKKDAPDKKKKDASREDKKEAPREKIKVATPPEFMPKFGLDALKDLAVQTKAKDWVAKAKKPADYKDAVFFCDQKSPNSHLSNSFNLQEKFKKRLEIEIHGEKLSFSNSHSAFLYFKVREYFIASNIDVKTNVEVANFLIGLQNTSAQEAELLLNNIKLKCLGDFTFNIYFSSIHLADHTIYSIENYMKIILTEKFSQFPELGSALMATGGAMLVDANPDSRWGIGDKLVSGSMNPGDNLMGHYLVGVRNGLNLIAKYEDIFSKYSKRTPIDCSRSIDDLDVGLAKILRNDIEKRIQENSQWVEGLNPTRTEEIPMYTQQVKTEMGSYTDKREIVKQFSQQLSNEKAKLLDFQARLDSHIAAKAAPKKD